MGAVFSLADAADGRRRGGVGGNRASRDRLNAMYATDAAHDPSIEGLLRDIATGDRAAFAELYDRISSRVMGLVTRVLRDRAQSEEVTQEVFLEIWQQSARFDANRGSGMAFGPE